MATLQFTHPTHNDFDVLNMHINQQQRMQQIVQHNLQQKKWLYLLSDQIAVNDCPALTIKISKPAPHLLVGWLEKIILAGQASTIVVDNLQLDEIANKRLKLLCKTYKVSIVNLNLNNTDNLIRGPW